MLPCGVTCSSTETVARLVSNTTNPGEKFSVIDVKSFVAKTYEVQREYRHGEVFFKPIQVNTSSSAAQIASDIKTAVQSVQSVDIHIPSGVSGSAITMMTSGGHQQVANHVSTSLSGMQQFGALAGTLLTAFGELTDVKIVLNVQFSDGSTATFETTGIDGAGNVIWSYQGGSAFTFDGVQIPSNAEELLGTTVLREGQVSGGFAAISNARDVILREGSACKPRVEVICIKEIVDGQEVVTCSHYRKCD